MQFPGIAKPPVGIVFDSAMDRIDDVLALAMLHGFEGKEQARIAAVSVSSGSLRAAQFCDALNRFYASAVTGTAAVFLRFGAIGLADGKAAAGPAMFDRAAASSRIQSITDTADPATLIRNALSGQNDHNAVVVVSGPATDLASLLAMYATKDLIASKVKLLCIAGDKTPIPAGWPTPVAIAGPEIGEALRYPAESIEQDFSYADPHPVAAAYRAYKPMPHNATTTAMAAMLYAVHPDDGYFKLAGNRLTLNEDQKDRILQTYIETASAKPVPKKSKRPADDKDEKKQEKKSADKQ